MKLKHTKVAPLAATLITFGSLAGGAKGAITLSIDTLTSSQISFTVSGTLDSTSSAPHRPDLFLLTPFSLDLGTDWATGLSQTSSSITIGGTPAFNLWADNGADTGDSIAFSTFSTPSAGTVVSGSATFNGTINLAAISPNDFELYEGLQSPQTDS